uniref:Uncharacterized protein n=1 Tax=Ditylenchus dipsaci TaxID=166011 RepID=A0A915DV84_9BILA
MLKIKSVVGSLVVVLFCALIAESCAPTATTVAAGRRRRSVVDGNELLKNQSGSGRSPSVATVSVITIYPYSSDQNQIREKLEQLSLELANNLDSSATSSFNPSFNGTQDVDGKLGIQLVVSSRLDKVDCDQLLSLTRKTVQSVQGLNKATINCGGQNYTVNKA